MDASLSTAIFSKRLSTVSARPEMRCTVSSRSWKSERSAKSTARPPSGAVRAGAFAVPPESCTEAWPVRPWNSSRARVSDFTGVLWSTSMIAVTRLGSLGTRSSAVTSPTRRPLKRTSEPRLRPETEPVKTTR
jgi:hypothetical protein